MRRLLLWAAVLVSTAACGGGSGKEPAVTAPTSITVTSPVLRDGEAIPSKYTCDGKGISPPLAWTGTPAGAKALALVVDDPDAPRGTFTHWVLLDLDPGTSSITEGTTPPGAKQANNSAGKPSYYGPCPPSGTHHYRFTVYALSKATNLADGAGLDEALEAIDAATIARGRLTALYSR
ncbi:YbhB/YbcL family Raf kinase inhibitor-like protein [Kribbella pratensis]|uniref:PBP family phospholipid-binding protein n=1 Tax=Kribbella pratensis TaxID=2512112 RepID=A0A4R8CFL8_9ACTN|nr:YbhB/YbcL family Raf kinase inhibitor-like protein [Kribbella pratensis]TDW75100.1 PBP family phospholipid-binding protein [Kribbella pratensis]